MNAEDLESEDVCTVIELARHEPVTATVAGEKRDAYPVDLSDDERIGRIAERRLHVALGQHAQTFHLVKARAADDANLSITHRGPPLRTDSSMASATR